MLYLGPNGYSWCCLTTDIADFVGGYLYTHVIVAAIQAIQEHISLEL